MKQDIRNKTYGLLPGIKIVDLALFLETSKTLIISDLHIGLEESLNKRGLLVPRFQFNDMKKRLRAILDYTRPKTVVINGDLKHEFAKISDQEWRNTLNVIDLIQECAEPILIEGNHDRVLAPIAKKREIKLADHHITDDIYITHGDTIPKDKEYRKAKTIIIGHEHPAITLKDGMRTETFKCFLSGKYKRKNIIVTPSFNLVTEGTNILQEQLLSPFLTSNLKNFTIFVVGDKIYPFGKVKDI